MDKKIDELIEEFKKYFETFDTSISNISKKYYHTLRVVEYAKQIAQSENLNNHDYYLAVVCALLHDIARFEQYSIYHTYDDGKSFNHGERGYEILLENDYINKYVDNEDDKNIVLKSVKNHNKFKVEDDLTQRELFFVNIVRDSDKIDIMDKQGNEILDGSNTNHEELLNAVFEKRIVNRELVVGWNNMIQVFVTLCFIFDLNYQKSFEIIKEKNLINNRLIILEEYLDNDIFIKVRNIVLENI